MTAATERIREIERERPDVIRLAESVSLAVLVDPPLLRRARMFLVPGADAGTEADLWLGPLVRSRSPSGIVFPTEVAEILRNKLKKNDPVRLKRAWEITRELHGHLSPAVQLEEEIAWLSVSPEPDANDRIEARLRSVLVAMVTEERRGLAHWAARAVPMLPSTVRALPTVRMLTAGAYLRLGGDAGQIRSSEGMPDWASWVVPADLPRVPVRVILLVGAVEFDSTSAESGNLLELPRTEPLLVDLSWDDPATGRGGVQVTFRQGEVKSVPVPAGDIRLSTVLGEVYDLRPAPRPRGVELATSTAGREGRAMPKAGLQESFWDNLLDYIEDKTVIPVIGSELVTIREGDQDVPLDRWLAQRLAADLGLPTAELLEGFSLNDVVAMHQRRQGDRVELYAQIHRMLRNTSLIPSESLGALADIPGFDLFVSLTFDSLLADAIGAARTGLRGPRAEQIAYSPNNFVRDLAGPKGELRQPVVFHLLGQASHSPDYVICDEDLLEFLYSLQDRPRQPKTLFDELRGNHLLILGCTFDDWLMRFFLRTARSLELSQKRRRWDVLVGDRVTNDASLTLFLKSFSPDTRVVPLPAAQFVTELATRWHSTRSGKANAAELGDNTAGKNVPTGAIFISYAIEDREAASRLAEGLRSEGLEVWFDKREIKWGEDWNRRIRGGIKECALFLPVISRQALNDPRSYYWREWNDAADFAHGMAPDEAFIVPVVIDDTSIDRAPLPDSFKKAQGMSVPDGNVTSDVAKRLRELVRDFHRRQRAL